MSHDSDITLGNMYLYCHGTGISNIMDAHLQLFFLK